MKPVFQTRFGDQGNCVAACYASLLEIPIEDVPDLLTGNQWQAEEAFLASRGLGLLSMYIPDHGQFPGIMSPGMYHMISGTSPRGFAHRVVALDGQVVHDPHPEGGGLVQVRRYLFIVPLNPARSAA